MERHYPNAHISERVAWKNRMRVKALTNVDEFLHWSVPEKLRVYALTHSDLPYILSIAPLPMETFSQMYGYFSLFSPIVGKVSSSIYDIDATRAILQEAGSSHWEESDLIQAELMTKVLAYRDLHVGDRFFLQGEYRVAKVFHLWGKMPAYGLVSEGGNAPILLFRGTDLSLDSQRGWASLMSDVDLAGPGFSVFKKSRQEIHEWLVEMKESFGKARVLGFSLGGALAAYTFIFENQWISDEPSYAFSPPGMSDAVLKVWQALPEHKRHHFITYVNRGDVVSKVGKLFGSVFELYAGLMRPVMAHTALMSAQHHLEITPIDVVAENRSR